MMDKVEKALKDLARKRREIEALQAQIDDLQDDLKIKQAHYSGMEEALRPFQKTDAPPKPVRLRAGSDLERARNFLMNSPTPLHVDAIMLGLGMEMSKSAKVSLAGSLTRYASEGRIFCKTAPNTFWLNEKYDAHVVPFERDEYA